MKAILQLNYLLLKNVLSAVTSPQSPIKVTRIPAHVLQKVSSNSTAQM